MGSQSGRVQLERGTTIQQTDQNRHTHLDLNSSELELQIFLVGLSKAERVDGSHD
jgi:hypothetical protein